MSKKLLVVDSCQQDEDFYAIMGRHFASLDIAKEMERQLYNKELSTWYLIIDDTELQVCVKGFASVFYNEKYYFLDNLYVFPEFRNDKIASEIVQVIVSDFTDKPIKCVATNPYALKIFQSLGFVEVGQNGKYKKLTKY